MRSRSFISLLLVVLCGSVVATGQTARLVHGDILIGSAGEPNDPNVSAPAPVADPNQPPWDPNTHLIAVWESVSASLASTLYNPAVKPEQKPEVLKRSLTIAGHVQVTDSNNLIGFCWTATGVLALDQNAKVVCNKPEENRGGRFYWTPTYFKKLQAGAWVSEIQPYPMTGLDVTPDAGVPYPSTLSRVEWSMYALVAKTYKTVDVPLRASDQWIELAPNLEILVEKVTVEAGKYDYRIKCRYDGSKVSYVPGGATHLWPDETPPEVIVTKIDILDPNGNSITAQGGAFGSSSSGGGSGNQMTGTTTGSGTCTVCGTATTIRYTMALDAYEKEVRFVLINVPVPGF